MKELLSSRLLYLAVLDELSERDSTRRKAQERNQWEAAAEARLARLMAG